MSKKKLIYAALLVAGFAALAADRLLTPEPATAAAAPPARGSGDTTAALSGPSDHSAGAAGAVAAADFPKQVAEQQDGGPVRDAFSLTPAILEVMRPTAPEESAPRLGAAVGDQAQPAMTAARFQEGHRLSAVMQGPNVAVAVVNGQWLKPGQSLDECILIGISGRSASFDCHGEMAVLTVEIAGQAKQP